MLLSIYLERSHHQHFLGREQVELARTMSPEEAMRAASAASKPGAASAAARHAAAKVAGLQAACMRYKMVVEGEPAADAKRQRGDKMAEKDCRERSPH